VRVKVQQKWADLLRHRDDLLRSDAGLDLHSQNRMQRGPSNLEIERQQCDTCHQVRGLRPVEDDFREMALSLYKLEDSLAARDVSIQRKYRLIRPENPKSGSEEEYQPSESSHFSYETSPPMPEDPMILPTCARSDQRNLDSADSRGGMLDTETREQFGIYHFNTLGFQLHSTFETMDSRSAYPSDGATDMNQVLSWGSRHGPEVVSSSFSNDRILPSDAGETWPDKVKLLLLNDNQPLSISGDHENTQKRINCWLASLPTDAPSRYQG